MQNMMEVKEFQIHAVFPSSGYHFKVDTYLLYHLLIHPPPPPPPPNSTGLKVIANLKHCLTSIGAACHASTPRASPVLIACGVPEEIALNALRISVGRGTTKADIDVFVKDLKEAVDVLEQQ